jgi:hypothetical protein
VVPDVAGRVKVKVVYTVLEAQYQSALTAAVQAINANNKKVSSSSMACALRCHSRSVILGRKVVLAVVVEEGGSPP